MIPNGQRPRVTKNLLTQYILLNIRYNKSFSNMYSLTIEAIYLKVGSQAVAFNVWWSALAVGTELYYVNPP